MYSQTKFEFQVFILVVCSWDICSVFLKLPLGNNQIIMSFLKTNKTRWTNKTNPGWISMQMEICYANYTVGRQNKMERLIVVTVNVFKEGKTISSPQSNTMMLQSHMQLRKQQNKILILKAGLSLLPRKAVQQIASGNAIAKSMQQVKDTDWETVIKLHDIAYYIAQHGLPFTQFEIIHIWKKYNVFYTGGYENLTVCKNFILNISDYFFQEHIKKKMELINFIAVLCSWSTDKCITEQEVIYVIYADPKINLPVMKFF